MGPNQNMYRPQNVAPAAPTAPAAPVAPAAPAPKPEAPAGNMMTQGVSAKKKGKGAILGMVFLGILAVAGISFGVWEMMSANQQKEELNSQITTLKQQNSELQNKISELQATIEESQSSNNNGSSTSTEILPPEVGTAEAVLENSIFTIKNSAGEIYLQSEDIAVEEIISCEPGATEVPATLVCKVKTPTGEGQFTYDYDEHSLEFVEAGK